MDQEENKKLEYDHLRYMKSQMREDQRRSSPAWTIDPQAATDQNHSRANQPLIKHTDLPSIFPTDDRTDIRGNPSYPLPANQTSPRVPNLPQSVHRTRFVKHARAKGKKLPFLRLPPGASSSTIRVTPL